MTIDEWRMTNENRLKDSYYKELDRQGLLYFVKKYSEQSDAA